MIYIIAAAQVMSVVVFAAMLLRVIYHAIIGTKFEDLENS